MRKEATVAIGWSLQLLASLFWAISVLINYKTLETVDILSLTASLCWLFAQVVTFPGVEGFASLCNDSTETDMFGDEIIRPTKSQPAVDSRGIYSADPRNHSHSERVSRAHQSQPPSEEEQESPYALQTAKNNTTLSNAPKPSAHVKLSANGKPICSFKSNTGIKCQADAKTGKPQCKNHTCSKYGCVLGKSSRVEFCQQHEHMEDTHFGFGDDDEIDAFKGQM